MGKIDNIKPLSTALGSAVNKSQQHQDNFWGNAENQTQGCWVRSKYATSVLRVISIFVALPLAMPVLVPGKDWCYYQLGPRLWFKIRWVGDFLRRMLVRKK